MGKSEPELSKADENLRARRAESGRERGRLESAAEPHLAEELELHTKPSHELHTLDPTKGPQKKGGLGPLLLLQTTGEGTRLGHGGPRRCIRQDSTVSSCADR